MTTSLLTDGSRNRVPRAPPRSTESEATATDDAFVAWPWAAGVDEALLAKATGSLIERSVMRGDLVWRSGSDAGYWYGVRDGLVKMSTVTPEGNDLSFIGIASGGWFGESTLLKGERRKYDIVALRDSRLVLMPREMFLHLTDNSPAFAKWLISHLNERLSQFIALLAIDRTRSVDARVARTLAWMFNPCSCPAMDRDIPITQNEIAHLASLSRPRTNKTLRRLADANLIRVGYGHVTVIDIEGLKRFEG